MALPVGGLRYEVASEPCEEAGEEKKGLFPQCACRIGDAWPIPSLNCLVSFPLDFWKTGMQVGKRGANSVNLYGHNSSNGIAARFGLDYTKLAAILALERFAFLFYNLVADCQAPRSLKMEKTNCQNCPFSMA